MLTLGLRHPITQAAAHNALTTMSTLTQTRPIHHAAAHGRAASLKQVLSQKALAAWHRVWVAMETTARLHAAPQLLQQASQMEISNPDLADALRRIARPGRQASPAAAATPAAVR